MLKIKTRKALQECARQAQNDEPAPERSAADQTEASVKYAAKETGWYLKKRVQAANAKSKAAQARQNAKMVQRSVQASKAIGRAAVTGVKAIAAGGWIAAVIILIVCFVAFFGAFFFSAEEGLCAIALSQVGNIGGEPYWSWYGYTSRVERCACFVSWCAEQCGYPEAGVMPKYDNCADGAAWFQDRDQWLDGSGTPSPGMIIFFDWDTAETNGQDGIADHTGIVVAVEKDMLKAVEGNSNDSVEMNQYSIGSEEILGYGILLNIQQKDAAP